MLLMLETFNCIYLPVIMAIICHDPCRFKNLQQNFILTFSEVSPLHEGYLGTEPVDIFCILRFTKLHFCYVFPSFCATLSLFFCSHIDRGLPAWHLFLSFMFITFFGILNSFFKCVHIIIFCHVLIYLAKCLSIFNFFFLVFSLFSVIRFKNIQCTGNNGLLGVCYSRKECTNLDGIASGNCARNWGTCCVSKCVMYLRLSSC